MRSHHPSCFSAAFLGTFLPGGKRPDDRWLVEEDQRFAGDGVGLDRPGLKEALPASLIHLEKPLEREEFDVLAVGRALVADPQWVLKARAGDVAACRPYTKDLLDALD